MATKWTTHYKGSEIKVINSWRNGQYLIVNNVVRSEEHDVISSYLTANIVNDEDGELIEVNLWGFWKPRCTIFIDEVEVEITQIQRKIRFTIADLMELKIQSKRITG